MTCLEVERIFKFLNHDPDAGILIDGSAPLEILASSDADWAGHKPTRKSTSGAIVFLGASPVIWSSRSQKSVALSSMESELISLTSVCLDSLFLRNLLSELLPCQAFDIQLHCDNLPTNKHCFNLANDSGITSSGFCLKKVRFL